MPSADRSFIQITGAAVKSSFLAWVVIVGATSAFWASTPAAGHDSWLVADKHGVNDGNEVWLSFVTGEVFPIGDVATDLARVDGFVDHHGGQSADLTGLATEDKALSIRGPLYDSGIHVIGCGLKPRLIELSADLFDRYVRDERASAAVLQRAKEDSRAAPVVERYTKYAKTLIEVRPVDPDDRGFSVPVGHRLEIIPLSNPCRWESNSTVQFKVLLDGHAWPNVPISVGREGLGVHEYASQTKTDFNGVASIRLTRSGHWFIKAHLIRQSSGLSSCAWESFWATLTFGVRGSTNINAEIQAVEAVHGDLNPWAVAGYRMARGALGALSLDEDDVRLVVTHQAPFERPYAAVVDGIQAATGVTVGKLSLRLREAQASGMWSEFTDRASGRTVRCRPLAQWIEKMLATPDEESKALALELLTLRDADLFELAPVEPPRVEPSKAAPSGEVQSTAMPSRAVPSQATPLGAVPSSVAPAAAGRPSPPSSSDRVVSRSDPANVESSPMPVRASVGLAESLRRACATQ